MLTAMSALSERLKDAKGTRGLDDIVRLAEREGHQIHRSVVARYLKGEGARRPSDGTILALAAGLGLDVRELRILAGMPPGEIGPYEPTPESARLNREQRDALDQLIRTIVRGDGTDARSAGAAKERLGAVLETAESTQLGSRSRSRSRQSLVSDQRQPVRAQSGVDEHDAPTVDEDRIRAELVDVDDAEAEQRQDT